MRDERFLARQSLVEYAVAADVETADYPTERHEGAEVRNDGRVGAQAEDDAAVVIDAAADAGGADGDVRRDEARGDRGHAPGR